MFFCKRDREKRKVLVAVALVEVEWKTVEERRESEISWKPEGKGGVATWRGEGEENWERGDSKREGEGKAKKEELASHMEANLVEKAGRAKDMDTRTQNSKSREDWMKRLLSGDGEKEKRKKRAREWTATFRSYYHPWHWDEFVQMSSSLFMHAWIVQEYRL